MATSVCGETLNGLTILEVLLDYLRGVILVEAEVPSALWLRSVVDDHVRAVLAQAETVDSVDPNFTEDTFRADPVL